MAIGEDPLSGAPTGGPASGGGGGGGGGPAARIRFFSVSTSASVRMPCRFSSAKRSSASICSRFTCIPRRRVFRIS